MSRLEPAALNGAKKRTKSANSWGFWRSLVVTLAVALGVRHFLIEARYIPSGSMLPGLQLLHHCVQTIHRVPSSGPLALPLPVHA